MHYVRITSDINNINGAAMIDPTLGVFILMNNYFHDVATALLLATSVCVWILHTKFKGITDQATTRYFLNVYAATTKLAKFALWWVLLAGVPRIWFYMDLEWAHAAGKGQIPAIIVKHILMFLIVGTGGHMWIRLNKEVKRIRADIGLYGPVITQSGEQ